MERVLYHKLGGTIKEQMTSLEFKASELHPTAYWNEKQGIVPVVPFDDFLCISGVEALMWLCGRLK